MALQRITAYLCPVCGNPFRDAGDARWCCDPDEANAYHCTSCGEVWLVDDDDTAGCDCDVKAADPAGTCACGHPRRWHNAGRRTSPLCTDVGCACRGYERAMVIA